MPIIALFLLLLFCLPAQGEPCNYHYFGNRKVSTSICYTDGRFGKASAYNRQGKLIYERHIRKVAGHATVHFSYYASGAVSKAEWSDAPDGGIQWYRSTTLFSESGEITSETEDNWDNRPTLFSPGKLREQPAETARCAPIWKSEFWFVNAGSHPIYVHADRLGAINETYTIRIAPGDTAKGGFMIQAGFFDQPDKYFSFSATDATTANNHPAITFRCNSHPTTDTRRYYYWVR